MFPSTPGDARIVRRLSVTWRQGSWVPSEKTDRWPGRLPRRWEKLELKMEHRAEHVVSDGTSVQKGSDSVERCWVGSWRPRLGFRLEYPTLVKFWKREQTVEFKLDGNATNPLENHSERARISTGVQVSNFYKTSTVTFSQFSALSLSPYKPL